MREPQHDSDVSSRAVAGVIVLLCFALLWLATAGREKAQREHHLSPPDTQQVEPKAEQVRWPLALAQAHAEPRSGKWRAVRAAHLREHPACEACGWTGAGLQVHHVKPFHEHPELELDPANLITLCGPEENDCHLYVGHEGNFRDSNPRVRQQAKWMRGVIERTKR